MTFASRIMPGLGLIAGIALMAPGLASAQQTITPPPATGTAASAASQNGKAEPGNTERPGMQSSNTGMMSGSNAAKAGEMASTQGDHVNQAGAMAETAHNGQSNLDQKTVMQVQQALNVKSDGIWGPNTEAALKQYQQKNGLSVTGQLDQATRAKMNLQG